MAPSSPWLLMLTRPDQAVHNLLHHPSPTTHVAFVLAVYVGVSALSTAAIASAEGRPPPVIITGLFLLFGFYAIILLCTLVARLLKGRADWSKQQLAFLWGQLPAFLMLLLLAVIGLAVRAMTGSPVSSGIRTPFNIVGLIWSTWTTATAMATVNQFSWKRGLVVALVPLLFGVLNYFPSGST